jgi:hypothetical protein
MARHSKALLIAVAAVAAVYHLRQPSFVSPPLRRAAAVAVPIVSAAGAATPAFADAIGEAAKKLADDAYPFMREVNWNSYTYLTKPGTATPAEWAKAIDKAIVMGAAMDPNALKVGTIAHIKAIESVTEANPVLPKSAFAEINAAIGRMVASVPEKTTMEVYNAFSKLVPAEVPKYLMSTVNEADAKKAYAAFLKFKDVVKKNPDKIKPIVIDTMDPSVKANFAKIEPAAAKLSAASYPYLKSVPWTSDVYIKPLPGVSPFQAMKAVEKALIMGASMDGKLLKEAAEAHHKALGSVDANLVTTAADYEKVNAAIGKLVATVPGSQVMDVFNAFSKITAPQVPSNLFNMVSPSEATATYDAFLKFKDVVKAVQR